MLNRRQFLAAGLGVAAAKGARPSGIRIAHSGHMWQDGARPSLAGPC